MTIDPAKSISAFYAGQSIFLTGATGFLGKVFIEKVLRSCPDVCEIFLLMRPKKGLNVEERLKKMLNLPLYNKLRKEQPANFEKLIPISGDVREKELGLSVADRQMLIERVTIIIHSAANMKMHDSIKRAIFGNIRATRDICILAQNMKNLIALVYISTAFTHVHEPFIEERAYPPIADWQKIIEMAEILDEHTLNIFTTKCLDCFPNTYTFSKNLAESVIQEYSSSLPCAIVRPSIITPTYKDPMPGWIDNFYGPVGFSIGIGKGLIQVIYGCKSSNDNVVPVDIVIKAIIVVTWKLGLTINITNSTLIVLHCISQKYLTYHDYLKLLLNITNDIPMEGIIWTPNAVMTDNTVLFYILTILRILPAILIDLIFKFSGRPSAIVQAQRKLYLVNCTLSYFLLRDWKFSNTNSLILLSSIPPDDRDMFSFEHADSDIKRYIKNSAIGVKKFLLYEDMNRLDAARTHGKRVRLLVAIVDIIISTCLLWIIFQRIYSYIYV
ncbi:PREDICTED: fatty acyl-CoA reductase 1-like [Cyphomyrmex costatus]|uniref:fatty acyl-CoA reductase 1-like n=1 Tax=Cyphomyrmex costatus TaxID=456900 RepID=UPI00085228F6|nr:PREDICTED: fatty acyl-CoA reductase 1-like [Cyphomyrmex costatus]